MHDLKVAECAEVSPMFVHVMVLGLLILLPIALIILLATYWRLSR